MNDLLKKMAGIQEETVCDDPIDMLVLTNADGIDGACVMLYPEYFKGLAERAGNDLYVLPSSVHEVIVVPVMGHGVEELYEIVHGANATAVERKDFLSNSVYRYNRDSDDISLEMSSRTMGIYRQDFA